MILDAIVLQDSTEAYRTKRGRKVCRVLCCLDKTKPMEYRLKNSFDYLLSDLDEEAFPESFGEDARITIAVSRIEPGQGGRPKFRGQLVRAGGQDGLRSRNP